MAILPVRTDEDHRAALAAIETCWGAPEGTAEGDKVDVLLALVDLYEANPTPRSRYHRRFTRTHGRGRGRQRCCHQLDISSSSRASFLVFASDTSIRTFSPNAFR